MSMFRIVVPVFAACAASALADDATVVDGPWRFTAVTERLIRIEHDLLERFVDEKTLAFVRAEPAGRWVGSDSSNEGWSILNTTAVSLRYMPDVVPSSGTVVVFSRSDEQYHWSWGDDPAEGNLGGTARTLDAEAETLDLNCHHQVSAKMKNSEMHCAFGLISQKGWAVINDTGMPVWSETDAWFQVSRNSTDVSLFMHGSDFAGALKDFFVASGPPTVPPRWSFGTMFTRWFNYDSDQAMDTIDDFESRSFPLDAWIFDMNWHVFGPWGSFSWNRHSFPRLQQMLDWIRERHLPIGVNSHEHHGVTPDEEMYDQFCAAIGCKVGEAIPFDLYNKSYALAQEDIAIRALDSTPQRQGVDFYWIDYQQGETDQFQNVRIPNLNPTIVLNMLRVTDPLRHGENRRSMVISRWGGIGSHRYPIGFSGDQYHSWKGLAFLPYFTSTAANVGYNYWSHDTVGGDGDLASDYELTVRWVQVSAWSPVLRFHDKGAGTGVCAEKDTCARILPWDLPDQFFQAVRMAAWERDELVPYIYTASCLTVSTGLALVRPMYYEDPSDSTLYGLDHQFLFGPDMVISPITAPSGPHAKGFKKALGATSWTYTVPKSTSAHGWVDRLNGDFHYGGLVKSVYGIHDVPGLTRQGAVLPLRPRLRGQSSLARARQPLSAIEFRIMPAEAFYHGQALSGRAVVIDDDGETLDFQRGKQRIISCEYTFSKLSFEIRVSSSGDFDGRPARVSLQFSFPQLPEISAIRLPSGLSSTAKYDHKLIGSIVSIEQVDLTEPVNFRFDIDPAYESVLPNFIGLLGRVRRARYVKNPLDDLNVPYGDGRANLTSITLAATQLSPAYAAQLPMIWASALCEVEELAKSDQDLKHDARLLHFVTEMLGIGGLTSNTTGAGSTDASIQHMGDGRTPYEDDATGHVASPRGHDSEFVAGSPPSLFFA